MADDTEIDLKEAATRLQAGRLGLALPKPALAGVVANLDLLAAHHAILRDALAKAGPEG